MRNIFEKPTADELADMADRGEDISRFFTNQGQMKHPTQQLTLDLPVEMYAELDAFAHELQLNVHAMITAYLRQILDQHYLAKTFAIRSVH